MQLTFYLAIFLGIITLAAAITWRITIKTDQHRAAAAQSRNAARDRYAMAEDTPAAIRPWAKAATLTAGGLTALCLLASSFWVVGTSNVGIITSFGRPIGEVSNGPQWTAPWENLSEMDYSVQVTDFTAASCDVQLRLADGQTACAKVGVRWQLNPHDATSLFKRYKGSTSGVENGVVIPALQTAANTVFGDYDPVALLSSKIPVGQTGNPSVPQLAAQVQTLLNRMIGSEVTLDLVNIPNIVYPDSVQQRINSILQQKSATQAAILAEQTADAQAAANRAIAASVSNNPDVLISRCLDLMQDMIKAGQTPTIGMCNFSGTGNGVIVSSGK